MEHKITEATLSSNPTLEKLPRILPNLRKISFWFYKTSQKSNISKIRKVWYLQSFEELPEILPNLESISFNNSNITNFENLTSKMPKLKNISFSDCNIHNFHGFLLNHFSAHNSAID